MQAKNGNQNTYFVGMLELSLKLDPSLIPSLVPSWSLMCLPFVCNLEVVNKC
jgi:hypothetical protein